MSKQFYKDWVEYYQDRGLKGGDIKEVSGYAHGLAQLTERGLKSITKIARASLELNSKDILLDVGCGAGLLTDKLVGNVNIIVGTDASSEMVRNAVKESKFVKVVAMADELPFLNESFDKIFCHSVFQYFPNYKYAARVITEMMRVLRSGGKCLIMDVPDIEEKKLYFKVKVPDPHNLKRRFYNKTWFVNLVPKARIFKQRIPDYKNSQFRFNVLIQK